jgi:hypothetical protein
VVADAVPGARGAEARREVVGALDERRDGIVAEGIVAPRAEASSRELPESKETAMRLPPTT